MVRRRSGETGYPYSTCNLPRGKCDELSQSKASGGLGLGTTVTSILFLSAILAVVTYLSITRTDATEVGAQHHHEHGTLEPALEFEPD